MSASSVGKRSASRVRTGSWARDRSHADAVSRIGQSVARLRRLTISVERSPSLSLRVNGQLDPDAQLACTSQKRRRQVTRVDRDILRLDCEIERSVPDTRKSDRSTDRIDVRGKETDRVRDLRRKIREVGRTYIDVNRRFVEDAPPAKTSRLTLTIDAIRRQCQILHQRVDIQFFPADSQYTRHRAVRVTILPFSGRQQRPVGQRFS